MKSNIHIHNAGDCRVEVHLLRVTANLVNDGETEQTHTQIFTFRYK